MCETSNPSIWSDGTPRSQNNAFTSTGDSEWSKDPTLNGTAARIGLASAATKRKAGKPLMPTLTLKGSTPKEVV